jgi:hypothetical protein
MKGLIDDKGIIQLRVADGTMFEAFLGKNPSWKLVEIEACPLCNGHGWVITRKEKGCNDNQK